MKYKIEIDQVDEIEQHGFRGFMYLELRNELDWIYQQEHFLEKFGVNLPDYEYLDRFGPYDELRVFTEEISFTVTFKDTSWIQFKFHPGFITDMASVPKFFRSVVDNDDNRIICAALCHDFLFSTHGLPFEYTNELFYQMCRAYGYNRVKSRIAYWAVNSCVGRMIWRDKTPRRNLYTRKTAEMMLPRPLEIDGYTYDSLLRT